MRIEKTKGKIAKSKLINPILYAGLGATAVLAALGVKSLVLPDRSTKKNNQIPLVINIPTPTNAETAIIKPTDKSVVKPTTNPYFSNRIKEIDIRIADLEKKKEDAKSAYNLSINQINSGDRPQGYDPSNTINALAIAKMIYDDKEKTYQEEIDRLNAEKSQIMLKM